MRESFAFAVWSLIDIAIGMAVGIIIGFALGINIT